MKPCIVWQTDFTLKWGAVAAMRGVVKTIDPELECVDITHEVEPYNVMAASQELMYVEPFWPKGTVFMSVVDPGVGTPRKAACAKLKDGNYVFTPDNGTLSHLYYFVGVEEIREIAPEHRLKGTEEVSVFHGRDIFAYTAALFASGKITFEEIGAAYPTEEIVRAPREDVAAVNSGDVLSGFVTSAADDFGSLVFNILTADFQRSGFCHGDMVHVTLKHDEETVFDEDVLYERTFGYVPQGAPIVFNSSYNYVSIGLNMANFRDTYHAAAGKEWTVVFKKSGIMNV